MKDQRDIETNQKGIARLLDTYRTSVGASTKDMAAMSYILEKSSRLSSVLLMVASVLDTKSSLRHEIDKSAIGLVKDASQSVVSHTARVDLARDLLHIAVLLETAERTRTLSQNNTRLLIDECVGIAEFMSVLHLSEGRRFIDSSHLAVSMPEDIFIEEPAVSRSQTSIRHAKGVQLQEKDSHTSVNDVYAKSHIGEQERSVPRHYRERVQDVQKDRRAAILGLLQRKDSITVRDVASVVKDCSEKTLQRELLALVAQGVLKKEGERRWSTYHLA